MQRRKEEELRRPRMRFVPLAPQTTLYLYHPTQTSSHHISKKREVQTTNEQEKKAAEANKAKDAKEAEEWKTGCTLLILGYELMNS
jgi:hypothetical protein